MRLDAADAALAGLALVEAAAEDNRVNRENLLDTTDTADLVVGLVVLAATMRASLAAAWGIDTEELGGLLRAQFAFHAEGLTFGGAL